MGGNRADWSTLAWALLAVWLLPLAGLVDAAVRDAVAAAAGRHVAPGREQEFREPPPSDLWGGTLADDTTGGATTGATTIAGADGSRQSSQAPPPCAPPPATLPAAAATTNMCTGELPFLQDGGRLRPLFQQRGVPLGHELRSLRLAHHSATTAATTLSATPTAITAEYTTNDQAAQRALGEFCASVIRRLTAAGSIYITGNLWMKTNFH
eukprot:COSAG06_NODE_6526_length_2893_cov_55.618110_3_plen_210_part_00